MIIGVDWSHQIVRLGRRSVDAAMEASIVGSFTKIGYNVRSRLYDWDALPDLTGRTLVVTGGQYHAAHRGRALHRCQYITSALQCRAYQSCFGIVKIGDNKRRRGVHNQFTILHRRIK